MKIFGSIMEELDVILDLFIGAGKVYLASFLLSSRRFIPGCDSDLVAFRMTMHKLLAVFADRIISTVEKNRAGALYLAAVHFSSNPPGTHTTQLHIYSAPRRDFHNTKIYPVMPYPTSVTKQADCLALKKYPRMK